MANAAGVVRLAFTPDGTRLVYVTDPAYGAASATLGVLDLAARTTRTLPAEVSFSTFFDVTADGQAALVTDGGDPEHRLLRVALDGTTPAADLRHDVAWLLAGPQPNVVATSGWTNHDLTLLDTASGSARPLGEGAPWSFSPDGTSLIARFPRPTPAPEGGPAEDYAVVDLATGSREPFLAPDLLPAAVLAWESGRPKTAAATDRDGRLLRVDVATDARVDLTPEPGVLRFLAAPLSETTLITATETCLEKKHDLEGDFCASRQTTFWSIDVASGTHRPVASTDEPVVARLSRDGTRLALLYHDEVHLKELP